MCLRRKLETRNKKVPVEYKLRKKNNVGVNVSVISRGDHGMTDRTLEKLGYISDNVANKIMTLPGVIHILETVNANSALIASLKQMEKGYPTLQLKRKDTILKDGQELTNILRVAMAYRKSPETQSEMAKALHVIEMHSVANLITLIRKNPLMAETIVKVMRKVEHQFPEDRFGGFEIKMQRRRYG